MASWDAMQNGHFTVSTAAILLLFKCTWNRELFCVTDPEWYTVKGLWVNHNTQDRTVTLLKHDEKYQLYTEGKKCPRVEFGFFFSRLQKEEERSRRKKTWWIGHRWEDLFEYWTWVWWYYLSQKEQRRCEMCWARQDLREPSCLWMKVMEDRRNNEQEVQDSMESSVQTTLLEQERRNTGVTG